MSGINHGRLGLARQEDFRRAVSGFDIGVVKYFFIFFFLNINAIKNDGELPTSAVHEIIPATDSP